MAQQFETAKHFVWCFTGDLIKISAITYSFILIEKPRTNADSTLSVGSPQITKQNMFSYLPLVVSRQADSF